MAVITQEQFWQEAANFFQKDRNRWKKDLLFLIKYFTKIYTEISTFLKQGKSMDWIADHYNIDLTLAWALRLQGLTDMPAGVYVSKDRAVYWNGCNDAGEKVAGGVYFYTLQAGGYSATERMLIVK